MAGMFRRFKAFLRAATHNVILHVIKLNKILASLDRTNLFHNMLRGLFGLAFKTGESERAEK
jgi:hypothetical protein